MAELSVQEFFDLAQIPFPASQAVVEGMQTLESKYDNCEIFFYQDVVYAERPELPLHLQIIGPVGRGDRLPLIIFIPGSGFGRQNVKERIPCLTYLVQRGFVVAALEYRSSGDKPFPSQLLDAKAGVRYMKRHAAQYSIDPEKIVLMGDSSGGHTSLMAAFTCGMEAFEEPDDAFDASVRGVVDYSGLVDFTTINNAPSLVDHSAPDSVEGRELGGVDVLAHPELAAKASVLSYISRERDIPPVMIVHGTNDGFVPFEQSCELFDALRNAGKDAAFYRLSGGRHGGPEFWSSEVLDIVEAFVRRVTE